MARNFSNVSTQINKSINSMDRQVAEIRSVTGKINQGAANIQRLASQVGNIDVYARQITDGFSDAKEAVEGVKDSVSNLSGISEQFRTKINDSLSPGGIVDQAPDAVSSFTTETISDVTGAVKSLRSGKTFDDLTSVVNTENIENFVSDNIKVAKRSYGELTGAIGGEFDVLRQQADDVEDFSGLNKFIDNTFRGVNDTNVIGGTNVSSNPGTSSSKIPNPLRNYNSYTYSIELGLLTQNEYNFPDTYRSRGSFNRYIVRSAGGNYGNRYQVADEETFNGHAEYFIEDLEIDAVVAPNPNTSVSLGTTVRFTVVEPFSMGNFIQALVGLSKELNYPNVIQAPFCLKIDFLGWDEYGRQSRSYSDKPIFVPINIVNMDFNVTGQGSVYQVEAVAYNEIALSDDVNTVLTTINANGSHVYQLLNGEDRSVTSALNQRIAEQEDKDIISKGDRYVIAFPKDLTSMREAITGSSPGVTDTLTAPEFVRRKRGLALEPEGLFEGIDDTLEEVVVPPTSGLYEKINAYALDTSRMNEIGRSVIVENTAEGGDHAMSNPGEVINEETDTTDRGNDDANVSEKSREHKTAQGDKINQIIEQIVLRSKYASENASKDSDANGTREWFKIETQVYLDETVNSSKRSGKPSKIYVYSVIPYYSDEAKFLSTNEVPKNTEGLKVAAVKEYNYIYTGKNEDILDFNLNFNQAFLQTAMSNFGQNPGAGNNLADLTHNTSEEDTGVVLNRNNGPSNKSEIGASISEEYYMNVVNNGSRSQDVKKNIAKMFHYRLINQVTDLVTAEMKIIGDPYFLPQQLSGESIRLGVNNGGTMNYMQNEVFVVVNFKTPFDFQVNGATMEFPKNVPKFSGLFTCWAVTNSFSGGKFEQTLKLIRRRGQDDSPTENNSGPVVVDNSVSETNNTSSEDVSTQQRADTQSNNAFEGLNVPSITVGGVTYSTQIGPFSNDKS